LTDSCAAYLCLHQRFLRRKPAWSRPVEGLLAALPANPARGRAASQRRGQHDHTRPTGRRCSSVRMRSSPASARTPDDARARSAGLWSKGRGYRTQFRSLRSL